MVSLCVRCFGSSGVQRRSIMCCAHITFFFLAICYLGECGQADSDSDSDSSTYEGDGVDTAYTDYSSLPTVGATGSDVRFYHRLADELPVPASFIALLDTCRCCKLVQSFCEVRGRETFPFCCITNTCRKPLQKITFARYEKISRDHHTFETPSDCTC